MLSVIIFLKCQGYREFCAFSQINQDAAFTTAACNILNVIYTLSDKLVPFDIPSIAKKSYVLSSR